MTFVLGGDPVAIRVSGRQWLSFAVLAADAGDDVTGGAVG